MNIIIGGAGEVGDFLCEIFLKRGYNVILMDNSRDVIKTFQDRYNVSISIGDIRDANAIIDAGVQHCDFFLSVTNDSSTNILSASIAKKLGAQKVIARTDANLLTHRNSTNTLNYQQHFGIDMMISPDAICAAEFAKIIRNPGRVAVENIAFNQIEIQRFIVNNDTKLAGRPLHDINIGQNVRFVLINHNGIENIPTGETTIEPGDIVTIAGKHDDVTKLLSRIKFKELHTKTSITIFGASNIAASLISYLKYGKYHIRVIDESYEKCEQIAAKFPNITVIHGDASNNDLLQEEQISHCNYFVACSDDDEKNTMVALQVKHIGAPNVMLALNDGKYESVLSNMQSDLGLNMIVSKRRATAHELVNFVSDNTHYLLPNVSDNENIFVEIPVTENSQVIGLPIRNIGLPKGCLLISLMRNFNAKIPAADDCLYAGDRVVAVLKNTSLQDVIKRFSAK